MGFNRFLTSIPWPVVILLCLTIGLAPFNPPHVWEKLQMLVNGQLVKPLDWFDLFMHGTPWILLILNVVYMLKSRIKSV